MAQYLVISSKELEDTLKEFGLTVKPKPGCISITNEKGEELCIALQSVL